MNKMLDGRPQWSNWGGLNDATRNQEFTMGSAPSDYTFGGILGTQDIKWNFTKFLVDQNGRVIKRYSPRVKPEKIAKDVEKLLTENKQ